jgi:GNAT superfamily N-acetyltransferase
MHRTTHITDRIVSLYNGQRRYRSLIDSALQGHCGCVYVDHLSNPTASYLTVGRFSCFGGDPNVIELREAIRTHPPNWMVPPTEEWTDRIASLLEDRVIFRDRVLFASEDLDPKTVAPFQSSAPDFAAQPVTRDVASQWLDDDGGLWGYDSLDAFMNHGICYSVDVNGRSVAYAGSYARYNRGIEVQVFTDPEYRRKGLAMRVCAHLILDCLERGLIPHWDAANDVSVGMAERFGYQLEQSYRMLRPLHPGEDFP